MNFNRAGARFFLLTALLCISLLGFFAYKTSHTKVACEGEGGKCNVILIMIDALSAQHIEAYGYSRATMPRTTEYFEKHGVIFDDVSSAAPWTFPSFTSIYFSNLASTVSFRDLTGKTDRPYLQEELRNHGVNIRAALNPNAFFILDAVNGLFAQNERLVLPPVSGVPPTDPSGVKAGVVRYTGREFAVVQQALPRLEAKRVASSTPYFVMLHTWIVHDPYAPQEPYEKEFATTSDTSTIDMKQLMQLNEGVIAGKVIATSTLDLLVLRYDQGIAQADDMVANFLYSLPQSVLANTVVIVAADHGEAFGEHGSVWHGQTLYQEELHVPLMMYVPGIPPGRIKEPVSTLDFSPTILSLEGVPVPPQFIGKSLVPLLEGHSLGERVIPFENGYPYFLNIAKPGPVPQSLAEAGASDSPLPIIEQSERGARIDGYKLMTGQILGATSTRLFNLSSDPAEQHDLLNTNLVPKAILDLLQRELDAIAPTTHS